MTRHHGGRFPQGTRDRRCEGGFARPSASGRSHRIDEEFYRLLDGVVIDDAEVFNQKLQEWEDFYNFNRPHGGLDGQTPYDRLRQKTIKASA